MWARLNMDLERRLLRDMGRAIGDHRLIEEGDRIMVAMSGGKDSYGLLVLLRAMQARAPVTFDLVAVHLDQGQPGYDGAPLEHWLRAEGVSYKILRENTYAIVTDKIPEGKTYCSLCARLRRGILYRAAGELGCNKIALGHHREDALETLLLNLFFGGKLASMPPRLQSDDGRFVVIRPLAYAAEADLAALAAERGFPILPCKLCGSQEDAQRKQMKALLADLERKNPTLRQTMLAAIGNVVPSHLYGRASEAAPVTAPMTAPMTADVDAEPPLIAAAALLR
jgi:tRNA 2-thiocytidine biosynthesis protein TtcA